MTTNIRIKMHQTYRINGTSKTLTRVPHGYVIRDEQGAVLGKRSTRKAVLKLAQEVSR